MSKKESENGSAESAGECTAGDTKDDKGLGLGVIFFIVAFVICFLSGTLLFPKLLYSKKEQPFNFNHKLHVEQTSDCESCHALREDGSFNGIPKLVCGRRKRSSLVCLFKATGLCLFLPCCTYQDQRNGLCNMSWPYWNIHDFKTLRREQAYRLQS